MRISTLVMVAATLVAAGVVACTSGTTTPTAAGGSGDGGVDAEWPTGPTTVDATKFDSSCMVDDDCVPVHSGDVCEPCALSNAAIAASAAKSFQDAVNALSMNCAPTMASGSCGSGYGSVTYCDANKKCQLLNCTFESPSTGAHTCGADAGADAGKDAGDAG